MGVGIWYGLNHMHSTPPRRSRLLLEFALDLEPWTIPVPWDIPWEPRSDPRSRHSVRPLVSGLAHAHAQFLDFVRTIDARFEKYDLEGESSPLPLLSLFPSCPLSNYIFSLRARVRILLNLHAACLGVACNSMVVIVVGRTRKFDSRTSLHRLGTPFPVPLARFVRL